MQHPNLSQCAIVAILVPCGVPGYRQVSVCVCLSCLVIVLQVVVQLGDCTVGCCLFTVCTCTYAHHFFERSPILCPESPEWSAAAASDSGQGE